MDYIGIFYLVGKLLFSFDADLYQIIGLSLLVSLSATAFSCFFGIFFAGLLSMIRFPGKWLVDLFFSATTGLPPVVAGLIVYILFSRAGVFGSSGLLYTPILMILTQSILILPIIISLSSKIMEKAWNEYQELFRSLCLSKRASITLLMHEMRFALIRISLAGFGRAIGEVGAVMIVGGNINHLTRVMTTAIAVETARGELSMALALGIILILIAISVNAAIMITSAVFSPDHYG